MQWVGSFLILGGIWLLFVGRTPLASILGIILIVVGGVVFWRYSSTRAYLNNKKDDES